MNHTRENTKFTWFSNLDLPYEQDNKGNLLWKSIRLQGVT